MSDIPPLIRSPNWLRLCEPVNKIAFLDIESDPGITSFVVSESGYYQISGSLYHDGTHYVRCA